MAKAQSYGKRCRRGTAVFFLNFFVAASAGASVGPSSAARPKSLDFSSQVQPLLKAHCYQCHALGENAGGLRMDSRSLLLKGGSSGPAIVPGHGDESLLILRITGAGGKPRMPLGFGPLSAEETTVLRGWIDSGAPWPPARAGKTHWAYLKPRRPAVPVVKTPGWVRNPIDAFVLANLEHEGLRPSPEADRVTLIRRVTLDLIGLPPSPQEVDAFVADRSPDAYDRVVTRLLASPHYGERMALPWLDAARYADSNGFQQDGDTYQYVWRDWVVAALNANMPFDRFTILQLAGDLLPNATASDRVATGFNRCNMLNGEGGAIPEEQRNNILFDRVDVTATTWLAATLACAQCHDHKYDPFTQRDYYSFLAFFNNVPESGVPPGGGQYRIADPWISAPDAGQAATLRQFDAEITAARAASARYEQDHKTGIEAAQASWESAVTAGKSPGAAPSAAILAVLRIPAERRTPAQAGQLRDAFLSAAAPIGLRLFRERVTTLEKQRDAYRDALPRVMVMSDSQPRKTHILSRGNYETPLAEVHSDTPRSLPPMPPGAPRNRLGLAEWLVSPDNPLTARVQVNRYWQLFFGTGLVKTSENLGTQCDPPSNQKLLDWLAVEFRESGWNVKQIQRLIVTSATYRQSSRASRSLLERDPENRLLARGARFRLPSMLLRDVALASSGLLNPRIGGKPVYPYQPAGIWDGLAITHERDFTYPQSKGADLYRRSLYTFWRRTVAPANMFDASVRNVCKVRLAITSTPLQALTMLNDVTWVEAGRVLAAHVMKEAGPTPDARLAEAFRRVCARRPDAAEMSILRRGLGRALKVFRQDPGAAKSYLKAGESPQDPALDPVQQAAYAVVCLGIYNLDEAMTRE